jgi:hypothetical protein
MKLNSPFIPLPYRFDVARLAHELDLLSSARWRLHPDRTNGNSALPLISGGGGDNDDAAGDMRPTPYLASSPYVKQVMAFFDEVFGRSRFMRLAPGSEVSLHVDVHHHWFNHVRIHIPVVTNPDVIFYCGDEQMHMPAGECWIFDTWRPHRVVNGGRQSRTHLVIDTAGSSRFWDVVERADQAMRAGAPLEPRFVPYIDGLPTHVRTERYGPQPVMSPGEVDHLIGDLIAEFEACPGNDPLLAATYRKVLAGFSSDWRALWYQYGIQESGWPHFDRLLKATLAALPDATPPLLLKNNNVEAKRVFLERVGYAALAPSQHQQFVHGVESLSSAVARHEEPVLRPTAATSPATSHGTAGALPAAVQALPGGTGRVDRNARCPCGSGLRYKHCHGGASPRTGR